MTLIWIFQMMMKLLIDKISLKMMLILLFLRIILNMNRIMCFDIVLVRKVSLFFTLLMVNLNIKIYFANVEPKEFLNFK